MCNKNTLEGGIVFLENIIEKGIQKKTELQKKMEEMALQIEELDRKIEGHKLSKSEFEGAIQARNRIIVGDRPVVVKEEIVQESCNRKKGELVILKVIKDWEEGISITQIKEITNYSASTIRTYTFSLLKDGCIKEEGNFFSYVGGLEGIDVSLLEDNKYFNDTVEDLISNSKEPISTQKIYKIFLGNNYDFKGVKKPIEKVSKAVWELKRDKKIKVTEKIGKANHYEKCVFPPKGFLD